MSNVEGFDFFPLHFDEAGKAEHGGEFAAMSQAAGSATDAVFISHGFRNDENDATGLYTGFLQTLRAHLNSSEFANTVGKRKFVVGGVYWPSKPFKEPSSAPTNVQGVDETPSEADDVRQQLAEIRSEVPPDMQQHIDSAMALIPQLPAASQAQDDFVSHVLSIFQGSKLDVNEGLPLITSEAGSELLSRLGGPVILPGAQADSSVSDGGAMAVGDDSSFGAGDGTAVSVASVFSSIFGRVGQFLNLSLWWLMKERSGTVGENGVAKAVRDLHAAHPGLKIHIVGHSLGGRLTAGCLKSLSKDPIYQPDSAMLLEAAFSHYGLSPDNGDGVPGYFRDVMAKHVVKGPFVSTFSAQDSVVGTVYSIASRVVLDNVRAVGDAKDPFGGIGRNGAQKTPESAFDKLHADGTPYHFQNGLVTCLDGSGGLIKDHGDVKNATVTYAFACVLAAT